MIGAGLARAKPINGRVQREEGVSGATRFGLGGFDLHNPKQGVEKLQGKMMPGRDAGGSLRRRGIGANSGSSLRRFAQCYERVRLD